MLIESIQYFLDRADKVSILVWEHMVLVLIAMILSVFIGVAIGVAMTYNERLAKVALYVAGIVMTIPSIAVLALFIPIFGLGKTSAIIGLVCYAQLPILRNTYTGIKSVSPSVIEAAEGMGMSERRILLRIKLPLALPVIMAGIRTSVVMGVGLGAIAAYIGAGGLGKMIFRGIETPNEKMIIVGAFFVTVLALLADYLLGRSERKIRSLQG